FQYGSMQYSCPPPVGQHVAVQLPRVSRTWDAISQRQSQYLEPGRVLGQVLWPPASDVSVTAGFREQRHDPLVTRLQGILESRLLERPQLSILQSLQDRGCDLLIEWPLRAKYGVQLQSEARLVEDGGNCGGNPALLQVERAGECQVVNKPCIDELLRFAQAENPFIRQPKRLVRQNEARDKPLCKVVVERADTREKGCYLL